MTGTTSGILCRVRSLLRQGESAPDAELLDRFVSGRDEEAFALLVRRHGPMVLGVCRRVLRNAADADDAFQATFLVLARRARSVRPQSLLGNWLHGVAYRTSLESQRAAAVRRARERKAAEMMTRASADQESTPELREVLDRELAALPDAFRAAIVLCDLEGLSRREAAARLGWSEGTLSGRLFRARSRLATRLARFGLAIPAAGLTLAGNTALAGVPVPLAQSTVKLGILIAAGEAVSVAAAPVAALTEGVMKAMLLTKLKGMAAALVVGCAVMATTAAGWQSNAVIAADGQAREEPTRRAAQRDADKERIAQLERERDELLKIVHDLKSRLEKLEAGQRTRPAEAKEKAFDSLLRLQKERDELARQVQMQVEKAREIARLTRQKEVIPPGLADMLQRLRQLEEELRGTRWAEKVPEGQPDRLKNQELEAAQAAKRKAQIERERTEKARVQGEDAARGAGLKNQPDRDRGEKVKKPEGDRVADLENRVKQLEATINRLIELQMRKK